MCGLVGVFGDMYANQLKFFKQALIADYFRGKHSTGMTCVKQSGEVFNKKLAIDPINFLGLKDVDDNILMTNTLMMGHNRHATLGGINSANAHPFEHGDITLMHNGTLTNKQQLQTRYSAPVFGTDSELVCWLLSEYTPQSIIPKLQGAFALTWHDKADNSFNFIRNDQRPMCMAISDSLVHYSSEAGMLQWVMHRNNIILKDYEFIYPEAGEYYKFNMHIRTVTYTKEEIELYTPPKPVYPLANVGGRPSDRFLEYRTQFGGNLKQNDTVFAYVDKVSDRGNKGCSHFDIEMSLVDGAFSTVKAFYQPKKDYPDIDKAFVVRGKVISCYLAGKDPYFVMDANFAVICDEGDKYYDEYVALAEKQVDEEDKDGNTKEESEHSKIMLGADGSLITAKEFREATKSGCVVCKEPIDAEKDISGDQETMIIGAKTAVCSHCVEVYENQLATGVN